MAGRDLFQGDGSVQDLYRLIKLTRASRNWLAQMKSGIPAYKKGVLLVKGITNRLKYFTNLVFLTLEFGL